MSADHWTIHIGDYKSFGDFVPNLFCTVGTVFAFNLKLVSMVDCGVRLYTKTTNS